MQKTILKSVVCAGLVGTSLLVGCGGGDDPPAGPDARGELFLPEPECEGTAITPFAGTPQVIISTLEIGDLEDGFDLDGDGDPSKNKLAAVGNLAGDAIDDAFADYSLMIPFEFFDLPAVTADSCVKFAIYLGAYLQDRDADDQEVAVENGDCNDHVAAIKRGAAEIAANGIDDNCNGLADDDAGTPSAATTDADGDLVTIAGGDCDDTNDAIKGAAFPEICGDGFDNDCDGVADRGTAADSTIECNPYDNVSPEPMPIDPLSLDGAGDPLIAFNSAELTSVGTAIRLTGGPSLFQVTLPLDDVLNLELKLTGTSIEADVVEDAVGVHLTNGRIGGIIDVETADSIRGLDVEDIGLTPENSLLDAIFANLLGPLLALPSLPPGTVEYEGCRTPDIDVDGDGLEAFCDSNLDDDIKAVDVCIDGDGTIILDDGATDCSAALTTDGKARFRDGVSVEMNFEATTAGAFSLQAP